RAEPARNCACPAEASKIRAQKNAQERECIETSCLATVSVCHSGQHRLYTQPSPLEAAALHQHLTLCMHALSDFHASVPRQVRPGRSGAAAELRIRNHR